MSVQVAQRYAQACFDWVDEAKLSEAVAHDLEQLRDVCQNSDSFRAFICDPVMSADEKKTIVTDLFAKKLKPQTVTFLHFLIDKSRLDLLEAVCNAYELIYMQSTDTVEAIVTSRTEPTATQLDLIKTRFGKITGRTVKPRIVIDPHMSGGIKIQIDDTIYDYSIENKLKKFKRAVINQ